MMGCIGAWKGTLKSIEADSRSAGLTLGKRTKCTSCVHTVHNSSSIGFHSLSQKSHTFPNQKSERKANEI
ncbi:hypothetical protein X777_09120 [Ooceraea biroi]|uniref:Uncharacterized protein n=1 Tax=Ooceraea biroi TaxID=2015173 RepID=A0A026W7R1_OOCBI|nr:hypothetical protein X777_09120 [Ooceraea biroi]